MTNLNELAMDFGDWFLTFHDEDYHAWFGSQSRETIENEILKFLENTHEETYSKNLALSKRIYQELKKIKEVQNDSKYKQKR